MFLRTELKAFFESHAKSHAFRERFVYKISVLLYFRSKKYSNPPICSKKIRLFDPPIRCTSIFDLKCTKWRVRCDEPDVFPSESLSSHLKFMSWNAAGVSIHSAQRLEFANQQVPKVFERICIKSTSRRCVSANISAFESALGELNFPVIFDWSLKQRCCLHASDTTFAIYRLESACKAVQPSCQFCFWKITALDSSSNLENIN